MRKQDIKMEDINSIILNIFDSIVHHNIKLTDKEEDKLYNIFSEVLEKFFDYPDYRKYN